MTLTVLGQLDNGQIGNTGNDTTKYPNYSKLQSFYIQNRANTYDTSDLFLECMIPKKFFRATITSRFYI